jgi:hypothetical protein
MEEMPFPAAHYEVKRLLTPADPPHLGCQLELVHATSNGTVCYINRFGVPLPQEGDIWVVLTSADVRHEAKALRLEGCQRLLLAPESTAFLCQELEAGHPITLRIPGMSLNVSADQLPRDWLRDNGAVAAAHGSDTP